ncbi:MAG: hypothetical protein ACTHQQ_01010 [Solirubrobacteraceae bacterium]
MANLKPIKPQHGAYSARTLALYREEAFQWSLKRFPDLDDTRRALLVDLSARIRRVEEWSDKHDIVVKRQGVGSVCHPIVESAHRWQTELKRMIDEIEGERLADRPSDTVLAVQENWERVKRARGL